ncbi:MAG: hypothetical protein IJ115_02825 [Erysipelotrichaceae bacterium]|nr:hypothetical protein [Erysipelotrichaceae bacterium]
MTRKLISVLLCVMMLLISGCQKEPDLETHQGEQQQAEIADFDYEQYLVSGVESYKSSGRNNGTVTEGKLPDFSLRLMKDILTTEKNTVFSPLNIYFNLAALAGLAQGEAREEIINTLGVKEDSLVFDYQAIWNRFYVKSDRTTTQFANSIWLNQSVDFNEDILKQESDYFYVPVFSGDMASEDYHKAFKSWLNDNTGELLGNHINEISISPATLMMLASTVYHTNRWQFEFEKEKTALEVFHGSEQDVKVEMMHKAASILYHEGSNFTSCMDIFGDGGSFAIIMPNEGVSVAELMESSEVGELICSPGTIFDPARVELSLPKFDTDSKLRLEETLPRLGITSVFDSEKKPFGELTETAMAVDQIEHACRVVVDEEGIKAAAYTVDMMYGGPGPQEITKMVVDRPFIFIEYMGNTIMFCGVINQL